MNLKEHCRHECLTFLVERPRLKFAADSVRRGINRSGGDYSENDVREALEFLTGLRHASVSLDGLGSTPYYQATSEGVLFHERQQ